MKKDTRKKTQVWRAIYNSLNDATLFEVKLYMIK